MTDMASDYRTLLRARDSGGNAQCGDERTRLAAVVPGDMPGDRIVRLDRNENPYSTPLRVQEALAAFDSYHRYPDPGSTQIRALLSDYTGLDLGRIVVGNGVSAVVDLLLALFVGPDDAALVPTPTRGLYAARVAALGGRIIGVPRRPDFSLDADAVERAIDQGVKVIFIGSPNDPTGNLARERDIVRLLRRDVIVVVDESGFEFSGRTVAPLTREFDNLVVLRALSAWAGLAGFGVGYGLMPRWIADEAWRVMPPYGVSVAAQIAVRAVFEELPFLRANIRRIRLERLRMYRALRKLNFVQPLESKANFLLVRVLHGTGAAVQDWLARDGILVRSYATADLSQYVRISVGRPEDTDRLIRRMTELAQRFARELP